MKKTLVRSTIWMLILIFLISGLVACGGEKVPEQEEIFSKTIHDFEGFHVVQLGQEEDQNFLVYAQETQQIQVSQESNRLIAIDQEAMVYTFADPDEQLLTMEPGTVFFAEASPKNPSGVAVKVKEIQVSGNIATVYSDPVGMEDLFEHVNIDMDMPMADVYYDASQLEDGMEIQVLTREDAVAAGIVSVESDGAGEVTSTEPVASADFAQSDTEGEINSDASIEAGVLGGFSGFEWEGGDNTARILFSTGHNVDLGIASKGNLKGKMHYQYKNQVLMRSIRVQLRYDKATNYIHTNVGYVVDTLSDHSLAFEGTWSNGRGGMGQTWPKISFFIPNTPIQVGVETFLLTELNGSMKGSINQTESYQVSSSSTYYGLIKVAEDNVCEPIGKNRDAKLELEGNIEVSYGVRADVGIPFVVDVFAEGSLGARLKGSFAILGDNDDIGSIHDCERCLDGDIELFAKADVGVDARIVSTITGKDLVYRWNIAENALKIGDFYASYREGSDGGVECGFGPCPHLRYRVTVFVKKPDGKAAANAHVSAIYPDQRMDAATANEEGVAELYLPNGDNILKGKTTGLSGTVHVAVDGKPTETVLPLEEIKTILFMVNTAESEYSHADELIEGLKDRYPEAKFVYYHDDRFVRDDFERGAFIDKVKVEQDLAKGDIIVDVNLAYFASSDSFYRDNCEGCKKYDSAIHASPWTVVQLIFYRIIKEDDKILTESYANFIADIRNIVSVEPWVKNAVHGYGYNSEFSPDWASMSLHFSNNFYNKEFENVWDGSVGSLKYRTNLDLGTYADGYDAILDIDNICGRIIDYALGQTDFILELMFEEKDAEGYIPVLPYEIHSIIGDVEGFENVTTE